VKLRTYLQRLLFLVGFALLAFYAAELHELILSRAGVRHFEDQTSTRLPTAVIVPLQASERQSDWFYRADVTENFS